MGDGSVAEFLSNRKKDVAEGRRLQGVQVSAEITVTNYSVAKSVEAASLDSSAISEALISALLNEYNKSSEVAVGAVTTTVHVVTTVSAASDVSLSIDTSVLETAIQTMGGTLVGFTETTATPSPTAPSTASPTASPTAAPTTGALMGQP